MGLSFYLFPPLQNRFLRVLKLFFGQETGINRQTKSAEPLKAYHPMSSQRLCLILLPTGNLMTDWEKGTGKNPPAQLSLEKELDAAFRSAGEKALFKTGLSSLKGSPSPSLKYWHQFAAHFIRQIRVHPEAEILRDKLRIELEDPQTFLNAAPQMSGLEYLHENTLLSLWDHLHLAYWDLLRRNHQSVEAVLHQTAPTEYREGRIHFHLVENQSKTEQEDFPFAFLATYSTRVDSKGKTRHLPLKYAFQEYQYDMAALTELLLAVQKVSAQSSLIKELSDSGELFQPIGFNASEAYTFLQEVSLYENEGIFCRIPNWWNARKQKTTLQISIGQSQTGMNLESLLDFEADLHLNGMEITATEAQRLLEESEGLALLKGRWVAVDHASLQKSLNLLKKVRQLARQKKISFQEAMQILMGKLPAFPELEDDADLEVRPGKWLEDFFEKLKKPSLVHHITPGENFRAQLRPYQHEGLDWLFLLRKLGLGACLADDMGLGKTIQVLALLSTLKSQNQDQKHTSLLIVPTTLISNWLHEIHQFSPDLSIGIAHNQFLQGSMEQLAAHYTHYDLVITSYGMVLRLDWLQEKKWHYCILDEAQAIKNPLIKQTKTIKKLTCDHRLALTGTPVENRLMDLWSLFDFLNPTLLGGYGDFMGFTRKIQQQDNGFAALRQVISPYILRRMKTDQKIIQDLPDKVELKIYPRLSPKQVVLYQNMVEKLNQELSQLEPSQRKALILANLVRFKQLCDHPDLLQDNGNFMEKHSGKLESLRQICETIRDKGEKVLIFTQFREMTDPLMDFLTDLFGRPGLMLHGGTPVSARRKYVAQFQQDPYIPFFILTLKAGGTGLNLTAANHVIHFDRWWNPAVENQATDRAYRIGQTQKVMVHKLICQGTIEEQIDEMITQKMSMAGELIQKSPEGWLTEMPDEEIRKLFRFTPAQETV